MKTTRHDSNSSTEMLKWGSHKVVDKSLPDPYNKFSFTENPYN